MPDVDARSTPRRTMGGRTFREGEHCHKYVIDSFIGAGGMGEVYAASDPFLNRKVAIKTLSIDRARAPKFLKGFMGEARVMAELNHPNIARFYDAAVTDGGQPYLVMELVLGKPLGLLCDAFGMLEVQTALSIAAQIGDALRAAHRARIIHRDLKPDNVLVMRMGQVKVVDFGLARSLARAGAAGATDQFANMGTPHYMSPEQALRGDVGPASDVYSLGVMLYLMLAGHYMFAESTDDMPTRSEAQALHIHATPKPLTQLMGDAIAPVWRVLAPMLAKDPATRPDANTVTRELKDLLKACTDEATSTRLPVPEVHDPFDRSSAVEPRAVLAAGPREEERAFDEDAPRMSRDVLEFLTEPIGAAPPRVRRTLPFAMPEGPRGVGHTIPMPPPVAMLHVARGGGPTIRIGDPTACAQTEELPPPPVAMAPWRSIEAARVDAPETISRSSPLPTSASLPRLPLLGGHGVTVASVSLGVIVAVLGFSVFDWARGARGAAIAEPAAAASAAPVAIVAPPTIAPAPSAAAPVDAGPAAATRADAAPALPAATPAKAPPAAPPAKAAAPPIPTAKKKRLVPLFDDDGNVVVPPDLKAAPEHALSPELAR